MAESKTGLIKVIAPGGAVHIVPDSQRKVVNKLNEFAKSPEKRYKITDYDPKNPDAPIHEEPKQGFSDVVNKMAMKLTDKDREIAELKAQLEAANKSVNAAKTAKK